MLSIKGGRLMPKAKGITNKFKKQFHYYLMSAPGMLWLLLFSIVPMLGILMAFQDYNPGKGLFRSDWIGWENFEYLFSMKDSQRVIGIRSSSLSARSFLIYCSPCFLR
jgi:ABC-type polysaccharide transport system permease subunit